MRILGICGSLQPASYNAWLLERFAKGCADGEFARSELLAVLPFYNAALDVDPAPPTVTEFRDELRNCNAVLIATPEYGHGMPGSLKNALDWLVGSGELGAKPVAITSAAQGVGRGLLGLAMLRQTLQAIDALIVWNQPIVVPRSDKGHDAERALEDQLGALRRALRRGDTAP